MEVGAEVESFEVGHGVAISAPHAQYVIGSTSGERDDTFGIPAEVSNEDAAYLPLVSGAVAWMAIPPIEPGDTVVFNGQGLVGNLWSPGCARAGAGKGRHGGRDRASVQDIEGVRARTR